MKALKLLRIERILQAFLTGLLVAGLMLSQVAAAPFQPSQALSVQANARKVEESETGRYFIFFDGESALQASKANKGQIQSASVQNQVAGVRAAQVHQLKAIEKLFGRKLKESKHFDLILNAVALPLSLEEAQLVSAMPGVKDIQPVRILELATDAGPAWVGADKVWGDPLLTSASTSMGEGVVIGVLDTGINFDHPSFASDPAISGDTSGYVFPKPIHYFGVCDDPSSQFFNKCNDKLIGAYSMTGENLIPRNISPEDDNGHGSHTASIAAGNRDVTVKQSIPTVKISGMAPHAQIIAFDVCIQGVCQDDAIIEAIQQSMHIGVDVINYSISSEIKPYYDIVELAFLEAYRAGIFISAAAGNSPTMTYLSHQAPWVTTIAATTHDRHITIVNNLITQRIVDTKWGDIRANFSWQGPADYGLEVLKPDLSAPGGSGSSEGSILAAYKDGLIDGDNSSNVTLMSGTSMATPFVAGAAALLISAHPDWTPAEIKSALMLTAKTSGVKDADNSDADPFDIGNGRIQVDQALVSGLVMDETAVNMTNANPATGGDPKTLNLPTMQNNSCLDTCSWTRIVRSTSVNEVTYTVSSPDDWVFIEPSQFTLASGMWQSLKITAVNSGKLVQAWSFTQINLTPDAANSTMPVLHLTAAVFFTPVIRYYFPYLVK